jgi:hypothetical protein
MREPVGSAAALFAMLTMAASPSTVERAWADTPPPSSFTELMTLPASGEFLQVGDAAFEEDGSIIVSDRDDFLLYRFDAAGHFVAEAGREGEGPGEFLRGPFCLSIGFDTLCVADFTTATVHVFDGHLRYLRRFRAPCPVWDLVKRPGGALEIACVDIFRSRTEILVTDGHGHPLRQVPLPSRGEPSSFGGIRMCSGESGRLFIAFLCLNRIDVTDSLGSRLASFPIRGLPSRAREDVDPQLGPVPEGKVFLDIALDEHGSAEYVLLLGGDYSMHPARDVYVLTSDGDLLTTIVLPEPSRVLTARHDRVMVTAADGTLAKVCQIMHSTRTGEAPPR